MPRVYCNFPLNKKNETICHYFVTYAKNNTNNALRSFFVAGMPSVGGAHDEYLDDYSSDDYYAGDNDDYLSVEEKVVHTTPTFVSSSSSQMVNEGDTIKLPCFVDKLGKKFN